jgi:hypothetical protein
MRKEESREDNVTRNVIFSKWLPDYQEQEIRASAIDSKLLLFVRSGAIKHIGAEFSCHDHKWGWFYYWVMSSGPPDLRAQRYGPCEMRKDAAEGALFYLKSVREHNMPRDNSRCPCCNTMGVTTYWIVSLSIFEVLNYNWVCKKCIKAAQQEVVAVP